MITTDVLIIGGGAAGLTAALELSESHEVTLISKETIVDSSTWYAQGGIAAVLAEEDTIEEHVKDTIKVGDGICDIDAVKYCISESKEAIEWLGKMGVNFTKDLVTKSCLANFSRTLSSLNSAGVPILEALMISKRTLGNRVFQRIADKMNTEIQAGQPIYKVLALEVKVIPIMFTSMFRIGEETGELSEMVDKLADFYEDEVSTSVKSLTSVLEPLMIVFVAIVVAFILVAMYLPMFNMMSTVG